MSQDLNPEASQQPDTKIMRVAHVYLGFYEVKFYGFTNEAVKIGGKEMKNYEILQNLIESDNSFENCVGLTIENYGIQSTRQKDDDWSVNRTISFYDPMSGFPKAISDVEAINKIRSEIFRLFSDEFWNQWNRKGSGSSRRTEQHFKLAIGAGDEYTPEMIERDLETVRTHDSRIRSVVDISHPVLTTVEAEYDRHHIHQATSKAKARLKASDNWPEEWN